MRSSPRRNQAPVTVVLQTPSAPIAQPTVSAALGRVLDQLHPTAWLPAALLVGDVALALSYARARGDPSDRWAAIGSQLDQKPFGVILGVLFALALVTILTQSLGFAAIRFFEGYWGVSIIASWAASLGIWSQNRRRRSLTRLGDGLDARALREALPLIKKKFNAEPLVATAIDWRVNAMATSAIDQQAVARADDYIASKQWLQLAPARFTHRIEAVDERLQRFPDPDRMMPTKLGLALRVVEDKLVGPALEGELRGYVIRNLGRIDPPILREHDEHRNRLDMYAVMCAIAVAIVPLNVVVLHGEVSGLTLTSLSIGALLVAWSSYRGAVAAAEEYGQALLAIDDALSDASL